MTRPFKGRPSWVMEFLTSSEGRMNCIWFRAAGVLPPMVSHPPIRNGRKPAPLSRPEAMNLNPTVARAARERTEHSTAKPQPNPRASRLTAEDAKTFAKAAKESSSLRPSASTSAPFALKNFVAACEQSRPLQHQVRAFSGRGKLYSFHRLGHSGNHAIGARSSRFARFWFAQSWCSALRFTERIPRAKVRALNPRTAAAKRAAMRPAGRTRSRFSSAGKMHGSTLRFVVRASVETDFPEAGPPGQIGATGNSQKPGRLNTSQNRRRKSCNLSSLFPLEGVEAKPRVVRALCRNRGLHFQEN